MHNYPRQMGQHGDNHAVMGNLSHGAALEGLQDRAASGNVNVNVDVNGA